MTTKTRHHITVNGRPLCEARMDIRHAAKGCEYPSGNAARKMIAELRKKFPDQKFRAVKFGCPTYSDEYRNPVTR